MIVDVVGWYVVWGPPAFVITVVIIMAILEALRR
jgi:hypothetical protein